MSAEEATAFAKRPFAGDAIRLRRWDDRGKVSGIEVPPLEAYRPAVERLAR
jgi:predicted HD phosphohydrolase